MSRGNDGSERTGIRARRRVRLGVASAAALIAAVIAGCGSSSAGPHRVTVTLLAPTSGVTVNVHALVVYGKVDPATATVTVGGRPVAVVKGTFKQPLLTRGKVAHIHIAAQARGYEGARLEATVHYKPGPRSTQNSGALASGVIGSTLAGGGAGVPTSSSALGLSGSATPFDSPQGRNKFLDACGLTSNNAPACKCFYDQLATSPEMKTTQGETAFADQTLNAVESGNPADLPPVMKTVIEKCAGQLLGG